MIFNDDNKTYQLYEDWNKKMAKYDEYAPNEFSVSGDLSNFL